MRSSTFTVCAILLAVPALAGTALAQPAADVVVNPQAAGRQVLLYPGGEFMRVVPHLLYPGQKSGPVRLHMPSRRRPVRVSEAPKPTAPKPEKKIARAEPAPAPSGGGSSGYSSNLGPGNLFGGPAMTLTPKAQAPQAKPNPPPTRVAKANPPPETSVPGLTRRSVILFAKDAAEPMDSALDQIRFLAGDLNAAMDKPSSRIELQAYGGERGDKGSDARRLSLKRALAIRQVLIDDGVAPGRIDVRAMGGAESGPSDRVDIYVKA